MTSSLFGKMGLKQALYLFNDLPFKNVLTSIEGITGRFACYKTKLLNFFKLRVC